MKYFKIVFAAAIIFSAQQARSQNNYSASMSTLESNFQKCQEESDNMLSCSQQYNQELDKLLLTVVKDLKANLPVAQRTTFRNEQTVWTQKKEAYFRELPKTVKADNEDLKGAELQAAVLDKKSEFLVERINELMGIVVESGE